MSNQINNIVTPEKSNLTIEAGIALLDSPGVSPDDIKAKSVGLQLTLLGLAEIQALRIRNLAVAAYLLEQRMYTPEMINQMDPRKLAATYECLNKALQEAINYVNNARGMDFSALQSTLKDILEKQLASEEGRELTDAERLADDTKREASKVAGDLLHELQNRAAGA